MLKTPGHAQLTAATASVHTHTPKGNLLTFCLSRYRFWARLWLSLLPPVARLATLGAGAAEAWPRVRGGLRLGAVPPFVCRALTVSVLPWDAVPAAGWHQGGTQGCGAAWPETKP